MANITEVSQWENVIRQLENGEAATGGADGLANIQAKQLANRTQYLKDNYLPLAGGALRKDANLKLNTDDSYLHVIGATTRGNGASAHFMGSEATCNPGQFWLETGTINSNKLYLEGKPNGELNWVKKGVATDIAGSAIVAKSLGWGGYVKYASGLIICYGDINVDVTLTSQEVTFPISFTNHPLVFTSPATTWNNNDNTLINCGVITASNTSFEIRSSTMINGAFKKNDGDKNLTFVANWLAIGV